MVWIIIFVVLFLLIFFIACFPSKKAEQVKKTEGKNGEIRKPAEKSTTRPKKPKTIEDIMFLPTEELRDFIRKQYSRFSFDFYDSDAVEEASRSELQDLFLKYNDTMREISTIKPVLVDPVSSSVMKHSSFFTTNGEGFNKARFCCPYCGSSNIRNEDEDFEGDSMYKCCNNCGAEYTIQEFLSHWNADFSEGEVYYEEMDYEYDDGTAYYLL